jgi:hypothetical protein
VNELYGSGADAWVTALDKIKAQIEVQGGDGISDHYWYDTHPNLNHRIEKIREYALVNGISLSSGNEVKAMEWIEYARTSDGTVFSYKVNSMSRKGTEVAVHDRYQSMKGNTYQKYPVVERFLKLDCSSKKYRFDAMWVVESRGKTIPIPLKKERWEFVPLGTDTDQLFKAVCY